MEQTSETTHIASSRFIIVRLVTSIKESVNLFVGHDYSIDTGAVASISVDGAVLSVHQFSVDMSEEEEGTLWVICENDRRRNEHEAHPQLITHFELYIVFLDFDERFSLTLEP